MLAVSFFTVLLFAASMVSTPGPNNVMILSSSLNYGVRRSLPHYVGICTGTPLMIFSVGLGLGNVMVAYPVVYTVVRSLGFAYLLFLAWKMASAPVKDLSSTTVEGKPMSYLQGVLFQWANPKVWTMAAGASALFVDTAQPLVPQLLLIALAFMSMAFPGVAPWLLLGRYLQRWLKTGQAQRVSMR